MLDIMCWLLLSFCSTLGRLFRRSKITLLPWPLSQEISPTDTCQPLSVAAPLTWWWSTNYKLLSSCGYPAGISTWSRKKNPTYIISINLPQHMLPGAQAKKCEVSLLHILPNQSCADASQTTCSTGLKSPVCSISLMTSRLASCLAGLSRSAPEQLSQTDLSKHPHAPHVPKALTTNNILAPSHDLEPLAMALNSLVMASSPCRISTTLCPLIQSLSTLLFSFSTSPTPNRSFLVSKDAPIVPHLFMWGKCFAPRFLQLVLPPFCHLVRLRESNYTCGPFHLCLRTHQNLGKLLLILFVVLFYPSMTIHTRILLADRELEVHKRCSVGMCQLTIPPCASDDQESQDLPHSKLWSTDGYPKSHL